MANEKVYEYCNMAGKILKDSEVKDVDTKDGKRHILKFSLLNDNYMHGNFKFTDINIWGSETELAEIQANLSKFDIVTILSGTLKEGSYPHRETKEDIPTLVLTTYPNQLLIADAKKDGKGLKYALGKPTVTEASESPF